jgi:hypothetical protein
MTAVGRVALLVGWATIGLGLLHVLVTPAYVPGLGEPALWFASGGLAFILVGMLDLLHARHAREAPGLRTACLVGNLGAVAFTATLAVVTGASLTHGPQVIVALLLALGGTASTFVTARAG